MGITAIELLQRYPNIQETIFHGNDFYIITKLKISNQKEKIALIKNGTDIISTFDKIIQFTKYFYVGFPSFLIFQNDGGYYYMINQKIHGPYKNELMGGELLINNNLYLVQKNNEGTENLILNGNIEKTGITECKVVGEKFDNVFILVKYKEGDYYYVQNNGTIVLKTTNKIVEIGFIEKEIPYCIYENGEEIILKKPILKGLI